MTDETLDVTEDKVRRLVAAVRGADACRESDTTGQQRVCGPCWQMVVDAAQAIDPPGETDVPMA